MQKWIPFALKSLKVLLVVAVLCIAFMALDASAEEQVFDVMMEKYKDVASKWQAIMFKWAQAIFWPLALISLSWRLIQRAIDGVDITGLFREIFWPGFFIGLYYYLLVKGAGIGAEILSIFMNIASEGSEITGMSNLAFSPSGIMSMANEIWWEVLRTSGKGLIYSLIPGSDAGLFANLLGIFVSFGIWVLMAMIAIDVLILLIASWVLLYGGLIILGFGGGFGFGFHQYAINYFKSIIALGFQLLGTGLIVTVGLSVMEADLVSFRQGFNLETLMSFLLCAMAMKMVVSSIPPMLAGMINGNVGSLGPKGEGVIGGLVGAGVTAATTTVSLGLGAAASAKMHTAQAGLDQIKKAVNARNVAQTGAGLTMPNSISAATGDNSAQQETGGSAYSKSMGQSASESNYHQSASANANSMTTTATPAMGANASATNATATTQQASTSSGGTTSAGQAQPDASLTSHPTNQTGNEAVVSDPMAPSANLDAGASPSAFDGGNFSSQELSMPRSDNTDPFSSYTESQLMDLQKGYEEQIRQMSAKRDYHYARAYSSLTSGAKTLFNYMAFFNNRGYF